MSQILWAPPEGGRLSSGLSEAIAAAGLAVQDPVFSTPTAIFFADSPVRDYDDAAKAASNGLYAAFFRQMLARGVALAPSAYGVAFCSLAHSDAEIDQTIEKAAEAAEAIAA